ncbi:MAG: alpha/beta hydrolase [Candidatus Nanoarchaeia archaeon]|nr:alpha/beta hydrolase [Candidatus Nanoarchaeia archaeon]MDD5238997.1 alpha/beta hydrolase [Candidatus Nanoarchaeia archaeon]
MQKQIRSFDGTKINYEIEHISENYIVFLHGLGGNLTAWKKQRELMHKNKISTIAVDMRGHGLSERPNSERYYSFENFARDIYFILQKENIKNFVLVGHCVGGAVTVNFHKLYPELAKAYILVASTYKYNSFARLTSQLIRFEPWILKMLSYPFFEEYNGRIEQMDYKDFVGTSDWSMHRISTDIRYTGFKSYVYTLRSFVKFDEIESLKKMNRPVLIISGSKDTFFDVNVAKRMNKLIKNSTLNIVPNGNHIVVLNNPNTVGKNILEFAKSLPDFLQK